MNTETTRAQQRGTTFEAAVGLKKRQAALADHPPEPPRIGDIYLSRRTADFPVEWLVVEVADGGRVRVMPLDDYPFVGSRDLELPERSLGGTGVLRCDLGDWVDEAIFEPELRTGVLSTSELQVVRRKQLAIEAETPVVTLLEKVVDGDPEYRSWREDTLRRAIDTLTGRDTAHDKDAAVAASDIAEVADPSSTGGWRWMLAAAAVLMAVALPLVWHLDRLGSQLNEERTRVAELSRERQAMEDQLRTSEADRQTSASHAESLRAKLEKAREAAESALDEQEARLLKRLRRALEERVVVNVPRFFLDQRNRQFPDWGMAQVIQLGQAERYTLSLEIVDPLFYPRYRLQIFKKGGDQVWQTDDLIIDGSWLRLDLPAGFLEPGEYTLRITGLGSGPPEILDERYAVKIK